MSMSSLNPGPSWGSVARAQFHMLARLQRRDFIILGAIVAALAGLAVWGLRSATLDGPSQPGTIPFFVLFTAHLSIVAAFWAIGVWRRDSPEERGYFWALPVARGPHTLLRVGMGWAFLMAACLGVLIVGFGLVLQAQTRFDGLEVSLAGWYVPLATATLAYLLMSVLAVLVDRPVWVVVWSGVACMGLLIVATIFQLDMIADLWDQVVVSLLGALVGPIGVSVQRGAIESTPSVAPSGAFAEWLRNYLVWSVVGAAALVLAAFRHGDAR